MYLCVCLTGALLFPTEDGAELKNTLSSTAPSPSKPRKLSSDKSAKRLLDAAVAATSTSNAPSASPEEKKEVESIDDGRSAVQRMPPKQKWHWAFRRIVAKIRVLQSGFGFTKTRVAKAQSVLQRLERMEQRMFFVPLEARAFTTDTCTKLQDALQSAISQVEAMHTKFSSITVENMQSLDSRIAGVTDDITTLQADLSATQKTLAEAVSSQTMKLQEDIDNIHKRHDEDTQRREGLLLHKLQDLSRTFTFLQQRAGMTCEELNKTIASNGKLYKKNADDSISGLLQVDTEMRRMRESLRQLEGDVFTVRTIAENLKGELSKAAPSGDLGEGMGTAIADFERLLSEGVPAISRRIDEARGKLQNHDDMLAERWVSLSGMMKAISNISGLSEKLEKLECEMENKVALSELQSMSKEMTSVALEEFQQPLDERMEALVASLSEQKDRVEALEVELKELPAKITPNITKPSRSPTSPTPAAVVQKSPTASIMNAAEVQAVTEVMSQGWNPADMEAHLHPLIKDIVSSYLAEWHGDHNNEGGAEELDNGAYEYDQNVGYEGVAMSDDLYTEDDGGVMLREDVAAKGGVLHTLQVDTEDGADIPISDPCSTQTSPHSISPIPVLAPAVSLPLEKKTPHDNTDTPAPEKSPVPVHSPPVNPAASPRPMPHTETMASEKPHVVKLGAKPVAEEKKPSTLPPISTSVTTSSSAAAVAVEKPRRMQQPGSSTTNSSPSPNRTALRMAVSGNAGTGIEVAEFIKLKNDLKELQEKFLELNRSKIDTESVRALLAQKADARVVDKKVDTRVVSAIEAAIGDVMREIGNLKDMQVAEIEKVKDMMTRRIKSSLKSVLENSSMSGSGATVSYKGLCMSCGQDSPVRTISGHTNAPNFIPSLNGDSTPGPEVYRSGFRMPVGPTSAPTSLYAASMLESISIGEGCPPPSLQAKSPKELKPLMIASASYAEESASVRSIRRKGFPGKTSQRAVVSVSCVTTVVLDCDAIT